MLADNPDFYPTPDPLIKKMVKKVDRLCNVRSILEPSAGAGDIVDYLKEATKYGRHTQIKTIEKDPDLQATLRGKDYTLIDNDFLKYKGYEKFDLIIANFPFSEGEHHLLKAIDILFSGQIVCLLNAETIKNPYTNTRKMLVQKLEELNAEIEFIEDAFKSAKRTTDVEVALIHIKIDRTVEEHLYEDMSKEERANNFGTIDDVNEVARHGQNIANLVSLFEVERDEVATQIVDFYRNYHRVGEYLNLGIANEDQYEIDDSSLTSLMNSKVNASLKTMKKNYWLKVMELPEVKKRLTSQKKDEFLTELDKYLEMDFSEVNIRQLIINLAKLYPEMIQDAILNLFESLTKYALIDDRWDDNQYKGNILHFNAWKTNNGYKVNQKVIMPFYCKDYSGNMEVNYQQEDFLNDLDIVARYFSEHAQTGPTMYEICRDAVKEGKNRKINTGLFYIDIFKKGTIHIKWKCPKMLRRFNIEACKMKNFLPMDYSEKSKRDMTEEEVGLAIEFEEQFETTYKVIKKDLPGAKVGFNSLPLLT